uniref:Uncharacterized protein n=1 Tax=Nelumbo nucifera TaxID=4432 RepID=A0A822YSI3_NELNU|nr:TPA_asm: hypothetical protein HUJ06_006252 [Nelumbo nucifera]
MCRGEERVERNGRRCIIIHKTETRLKICSWLRQFFGFRCACIDCISALFFSRHVRLSFLVEAMTEMTKFFLVPQVY